MVDRRIEYRGNVIEVRTLPYLSGGWSAHGSITKKDMTLASTFQIDKTFASMEVAFEAVMRSAVHLIESDNAYPTRARYL